MKCTYNNVYLYNGDCRNVFKSIDSESVDFVAAVMSAYFSYGMIVSIIDDIEKKEKWKWHWK